MVNNMNQQRKLSRHNSRQSSIGETASVGSFKSVKSDGSADFSNNCLVNQQQQQQQQQQSANKKANGLTKHGSQDSGDSLAGTTSILNVAEMLLHGVADNEILDIWLRSIQCEEFVVKFIDAGYDMPTISRITPQDLTAIGVTEPTKRMKILTEIKKLNLQDGIPNFLPASLSHWLSLIRLDSYYYKSLCDQQVDTIEKLCQLTWEDFEELGITKLGHQKRIQLAIERVKELEADQKSSTKPMSEPIYDTNPSQILLVASAENHITNGLIINKQSSTSELSSTGSGSMHSVYSAASTQYMPSYAPITDNQQQQQQQQPLVVSQTTNENHSQQQSQVIYSQPPPPQMMYQQISPMSGNVTIQQQKQSHNQQSHQTVQQPASNTNQSLNSPQSHYMANGAGVVSDNNIYCSNGVTSQQYRHSMSQLPFSALAKLPKHQQQLLQQSSIYATLSRQPSKSKQPPPPVPIRTNSLKTNSLTDEFIPSNQQPQPPQQAVYQQTHLKNGNSTCSLSRSGTRVTSRSQFNPSTMLSKNKSFSGNAYMEASRARFLNRNNQQPNNHQQQQHQPHQTTTSTPVDGPATADCNVTTGQDDDFPPPPSPLSITDSDENDLLPIDSNAPFTDVNHALMTFRVVI